MRAAPPPHPPYAMLSGPLGEYDHGAERIRHASQCRLVRSVRRARRLQRWSRRLDHLSSRLSSAASVLRSRGRRAGDQAGGLDAMPHVRS